MVEEDVAKRGWISNKLDSIREQVHGTAENVRETSEALVEKYNELMAELKPIWEN